MFDRIKNIMSAQELRRKVDELTKENDVMKQQLLPEHREIIRLQQEIDLLLRQHDATLLVRQQFHVNIEKERNQLQSQIQVLNDQIIALNNEIYAKRLMVASLDDDIFMQDFGVHQPIFRLSSSDAYKRSIDEIIAKQKAIIKSNWATKMNPNWLVNGSVKEGKRMNDSNIKQILRSFNNECDVMIDKVRFNNYDMIRSRIEKSFQDLNKMNATNEVSILPPYLYLKIEELNLCFEYEQIKQREKENQARERAPARRAKSSKRNRSHEGENHQGGNTFSPSVGFI